MALLSVISVRSRSRCASVA